MRLEGERRWEVDIGEAAKKLNISVRSVRRLVASGELVAKKIRGTRGGKLDFSDSNLTEYLANQEITGKILEDLPDLMSVDVVAKYLGVERPTVMEAIREDILRAIKLGKGYKVKKEDLRKFVEEL